MQQTTNYGLRQWGQGDKFRRSDVNQNFELVDGALQSIYQMADGKAVAAAGSYVGDGTSLRFISLGFTPKVVLLMGNGTETKNGDYIYGGMAVTGRGSGGITITTNGFNVVESGNLHCNCNHTQTATVRVYFYAATG